MVMSLVYAAAQTPDPQAPGQVSDPARPALNPFPAEQDWSFLARPAQHPDFFDPAKYIRLGDDPQKYISFGLEYRTEYEYYDNWLLGAGAQDPNGYVFNSVMPHFDLHAGPDFRLFSEWEFDYVAGRVGFSSSTSSRTCAWLVDWFLLPPQKINLFCFPAQRG